MMLVLVLSCEAIYFNPQSGAPMALPAVVLVAAVLSALTVQCLLFAVMPSWDPLGLSDNGRQLYVYAAQVLAVLVGVHLFLTQPQIFNLNIMRQYWLLVVMAVAFTGAALAEWERALRPQGIDYAIVDTDRPLSLALRAYLRKRERLG